MFLKIFDLRLSILLTFSIVAYPECTMERRLQLTQSVLMVCTPGAQFIIIL